MSAMIGFFIGVFVGAVLLMAVAVAVNAKETKKIEEEFRRTIEDDRQD